MPFDVNEALAMHSYITNISHGQYRIFDHFSFVYSLFHALESCCQDPADLTSLQHTKYWVCPYVASCPAIADMIPTRGWIATASEYSTICWTFKRHTVEIAKSYSNAFFDTWWHCRTFDGRLRASCCLLSMLPSTTETTTIIITRPRNKELQKELKSSHVKSPFSRSPVYISHADCEPTDSRWQHPYAEEWKLNGLHMRWRMHQQSMARLRACYKISKPKTAGFDDCCRVIVRTKLYGDRKLTDYEIGES